MASTRDGTYLVATPKPRGLGRAISPSALSIQVHWHPTLEVRVLVVLDSITRLLSTLP